MRTPSETSAQIEKWPRAIRSLKYRNFRFFWAGQIVSQIGNWMQIVAQSWIVYELTDSPLMLSLVNFVALVPVVPISLLAGVLSDRFPRRKIILAAEFVLMAQALIMAILIWLNLIQVWHVMVLSFILGAAAAVEQPARLAFMLDVVGKDDLSNAVGLTSSGNNAAHILGPMLAGVIIASFGEFACFLINGFSYLAVILALFAIRLPNETRKEEFMPVVGSLKDGFSYLKGNKIILGLLFTVSIASFLTIPYITLMPVYAKDIFRVGPNGLGYLMTAVGVGSIIGAFWVASLRAGSRGKWLLVANIIGSVCLTIFAFSGAFWISMFLVLLIGASNAIRLALANSLTQLSTSDEYHGRVMSVFNLLFNGMSRVGALAIGGLAEFITVPWALGSSALIGAVISLTIFFSMPSIRGLE